MAKVLYPNYNGVYSTLHDTIERPEETNAGADAILIAGVAKRGPMNRFVTVDDNNVEEIFGDVEELGVEEYQRSAVKGFYEVRASQTGPGNISIMRVGNARRSSMELFENRVYVSGDLSYTDDSEGYATSMVVEALEDGREEFSIDIDADEYGRPKSARCRMPYIDENGDESIRDITFALDPQGLIDGAFSRPTELAGAINADPEFSQKVFAGVPLLEEEVEIDIIQASGLPVGIPKKTYEISDDEKSYGDKLSSIDSIYSYKDVTETMDAGVSTFTASEKPNKTADTSVPTISSAYVIKEGEIVVQNITMANVGGDSATLKCATDASWDYTAPSESITDLEMYIIRGGVRTDLEAADYSIDNTTGEITFETGSGKAVEGGFQVGDVIGASYKYKVSMTEAKNRSDLTQGNKRNYFVIGKDIIFGSSTTNDIEITYESVIEYEIGVDVVIGDPNDASVDGYKDAVFTFVNASNIPSVGDTIYVAFSYEPELPAYTGYVYPDNVTTQPAGLSGGSNGTSMSLYDYREIVRDAFDEAENYPCRYIVVQGAYFNDVTEGYNAETGLPEEQNVAWHDVLKVVTDRKSNFVSECESIITHAPLINPSAPNAYTDWLNRMTSVSLTDPLRSANVASTMTDFRLSVIAGEVVAGGVPGKGAYPVYTPNILAAMKSELPLGETLTHKQLPGNVVGMRYLIKSARQINKLNAMRYTTLGIEVENVLDQTASSVKIMDAPTMATEGSSFDRQAAYRAIVEGLRIIRRTLKPFIGKMLDDTLLITIDNRLNENMQELVAADVLDLFVIEVSATRNQLLEGTSAVKFHGITGSEARKFEVDTTASKVA